MDASQFILPEIRFGILQMQYRPFWQGDGVKPSKIPLDQASREFVQQELESGLTERL